MFWVSWLQSSHDLTTSHIHVSLQDKSGRNIFALTDQELEAGGRQDAPFEPMKYMTQEAEWFLAGLVDGLPDGELHNCPIGADMIVVPMMCPTINSYKRLLGGEALWAPDTASYAYESRAASIRIISPPGSGTSATRFEVRVPGADVSQAN